MSEMTFVPSSTSTAAPAPLPAAQPAPNYVIPPQAQPTPGEAPAAQPAPAAPSMPELDYLRQHGFDTAELQGDLERLLARAPDLNPPAAAPQMPPLVPQTEAPASAPQPQPPVAQPTPQEAALDPYAPQAPKPRDTDPDAEPGEVTIGADGKVHDAKTGKYVPHQALHAERVKRQELQNELVRLREEQARADERLTMLTQIMEGQRQVQQPAPAAPAAPEPDIDPEVDIFGAFKQMKARADALNQQITETRQQTSGQLAQIQQADRYRQDVTRFASENPDFFDAYKHLQKSREAELKILGLNDPKAIERQIVIEEQNLVRAALNGQNMSPARMMYELAKAKGYAGRAPAPQPQPQPAPQPAPQPQYQYQQPSQQPPQAVLAPQPQPIAPNPNAAAQLLNMQQTMQASASLGNAGGAPGEGLTVEQLVNMSEDDFLQFAGKLGMKKLDSLLRG